MALKEKIRLLEEALVPSSLIFLSAITGNENEADEEHDDLVNN